MKNNAKIYLGGYDMNVKKLVKKILLVILCVLSLTLLFVVEEGIRAYLYYYCDLRPETPTCEGIQCYTEGHYLEYNGGIEASKYLSQIGDLDKAIYSNFYYKDTTPSETLFGNGAIAFCVGIQYNEDDYDAEKEKILSENGTPIFIDGTFSEGRALAEEKIGLMKHLYYFVFCSDETDSIVYFVCIDNQEHEAPNYWWLGDAICMRYTDFWDYFFFSGTQDC